MNDKKIETLDDIRDFLEGTWILSFPLGIKMSVTDGLNRHWPVFDTSTWVRLATG
ncbi:MAG: hypothetical protein GY934_24240 [Gammaproteobacteria bacterium]|nr:hypothetical protein [Gammaproteobacteria bacterium]